MPALVAMSCRAWICVAEAVESGPRGCDAHDDALARIDSSFLSINCIQGDDRVDNSIFYVFPRSREFGALRLRCAAVIASEAQYPRRSSRGQVVAGLRVAWRIGP